MAGELDREDTAEGVRVKARVPAGCGLRFERFAVNGNGAAPGVRFTPLSADAREPVRAHEGDAGYDLHAVEAARSSRASAHRSARASRSSCRRVRRARGAALGPGGEARHRRS